MVCFASVVLVALLGANNPPAQSPEAGSATLPERYLRRTVRELTAGEWHWFSPRVMKVDLDDRCWIEADAPVVPVNEAGKLKIKVGRDERGNIYVGLASLEQSGPLAVQWKWRREYRNFGKEGYLPVAVIYETK